MSLSALDDIATHTGTAEPIHGVVRIETTPLEDTAATFFTQMRSVYPHSEVFGQYCTVNDYVDCPPDELFEYLSDTRSLEEWTYTLRDFTATDDPGLWTAYDRLLPDTTIYTRTVANSQRPHRRLPLRLGPGRAPVDDLRDASPRRAGSAGQAGFSCAVDELPPSVLRQQPLSRGGPGGAAPAGWATSGICSVLVTRWS